MSPTPVSPSIIVPATDNVLMDVDSDPEAKQAAQELIQAQEWVRTINKAQDRRWEEQKRLEEEEEV